MTVLLDTHVLIWLAEDNRKLGAKAANLADKALQRDELEVAAISFWEAAMLASKGRLDLQISIEALRRSVLEQGIQEVAMTGAIGIVAAQLEDFHGDPADRMIVATAKDRGSTLITADRHILTASAGVVTLDARL